MGTPSLAFAEGGGHGLSRGKWFSCGGAGVQSWEGPSLQLRVFPRPALFNPGLNLLAFVLLRPSMDEHPSLIHFQVFLLHGFKFGQMSVSRQEGHQFESGIVCVCVCVY